MKDSKSIKSMYVVAIVIGVIAIISGFVELRMGAYIRSNVSQLLSATDSQFTKEELLALASRLIYTGIVLIVAQLINIVLAGFCIRSSQSSDPNKKLAIASLVFAILGGGLFYILGAAFMISYCNNKERENRSFTQSAGSSASPTSDVQDPTREEGLNRDEDEPFNSFMRNIDDNDPFNFN